MTKMKEMMSVLNLQPSSRGSEQRPSEAKRVIPLSGRNLAEDWDGLRKLKEQQNFMRNPRFLPLHVNPLARPQNKAEPGPLQGDSTLSPVRYCCYTPRHTTTLHHYSPPQPTEVLLLRSTSNHTTTLHHYSPPQPTELLLLHST